MLGLQLWRGRRLLRSRQVVVVCGLRLRIVYRSVLRRGLRDLWVGRGGSKVCWMPENHGRQLTVVVHILDFENHAEDGPVTPKYRHPLKVMRGDLETLAIDVEDPNPMQSRARVLAWISRAPQNISCQAD